MKRRVIGVLGGLTSAALIASALQAPAAAVPPENPSEQGAVKGKKDDRPDPREERRRELNQKGAELVLNGKRQVQERDGSKAVRVAPGQWVQYGTNSSDQLLSFLVEFAGSTKGGGKGGKGGKSSGTTDPTTTTQLHNQIPQPDRSTDNSTYWKPDFSRQHYLDMFFHGMPDQGGESFKAIYEEMSSGRYTVNGDVGDWVQVPKTQADYGTTESHADMTYFIDDTAEAWYSAQIAAGKTADEVVAYLKTFDQWDRYDHDGDGDFAEADGYIDHFQAIHAGEGEEAGAPEGAIWSHRWAVNQNGFHSDGVGPDAAPFGGIEIGNTGLWIRDYTTEPENGGLGVFVHEYGHDLGLPDLYDTAGGENGTGFWTLMSSGSWLGDNPQAIGTTPNHMGPWEKFQLGWLDYEVARTGQTSSHDLGPSFRATKKAQAVITILPRKTVTQNIGPAYEGSNYFYSGRGDERVATLTSPSFTVPATGGQLTSHAKYDIEVDWDYAYAELSVNGGAWTPLQTSLSTSTNPNGTNDGHGITGTSNGWVPLTATLPSSAGGQQARLRFRMENDEAINGVGFSVDAIDIAGVESNNAENGVDDWAVDLFAVAEGGQVKNQYSHYYIAEYRTYGGYDKTLKTGPYNFGFAATQPNRVEHFPYQDGLLIWYWDTTYGDNNTSLHPGGGEALPIDARGTALKWSDGAIARNRIQSFDATFGMEATDPISLHRDTANGTETLEVAAQPAITVFDDRFPERYYDSSNPRHSAKVTPTGTRIEIISTTPNTSMQVVVR